MKNNKIIYTTILIIVVIVTFCIVALIGKNIQDEIQNRIDSEYRIENYCKENGYNDFYVEAALFKKTQYYCVKTDNELIIKKTEINNIYKIMRDRNETIDIAEYLRGEYR